MPPRKATFWITRVELKKLLWGTSLVVQWLRIRLPMQGTWVRSLDWEDPTCRGATKSVRHNYWAHTRHNYWSPHALGPTCCNYWARMPRARALQQEKPPQWEACAPQQRVAPLSLQLKKAYMQQWRCNTAKKSKLVCTQMTERWYKWKNQQCKWIFILTREEFKKLVCTEMTERWYKWKKSEM